MADCSVGLGSARRRYTGRTFAVALTAGLAVSCGSDSEDGGRRGDTAAAEAGEQGGEHGDLGHRAVAGSRANEGGHGFGAATEGGSAATAGTAGLAGGQSERAVTSTAGGGCAGAEGETYGGRPSRGGSPVSDAGNASAAAATAGDAGARVPTAGSSNASAGGSPAAGAGGIAAAADRAQGGAASGAGGSAGSGSCTAAAVVNLVFVVDKSGSMGDGTSSQPEGSILWQYADLRWTPLRAAMSSFLENPGASGLLASLTFFPCEGGYDTACSVASYETPSVPLASLADPSPLLDALDTTTPGGGTPTLPALLGAIQYAQQLEATDPESQSLVVLLSGGEPIVVDGTGEARTDDCPPGNGNTIENIAAAAAAARAASPPVPVHVIGFDEEAQGLTPIAAAAQTEFYYVSGENVEERTAVALAALHQIRASAAGCPASEGGPSGE